MATETKAEGGQQAAKSDQQKGAQGNLQGSEARKGQQDQQVEVRQGREGGVERRGEGRLARYGRDPFSMMQQLSDEMDQLFDSFFYGAPTRRPAQFARAPSLWAPDVEVCEEVNKWCVRVDLPGVPKDNVKIDIQEGMLTIQGERREERTEGTEQQGFRRSERHYGSFYRSIPLPEGIDPEQAQAQMKEGVLEITMPITQPKQARRLEIKG